MIKLDPCEPSCDAIRQESDRPTLPHDWTKAELLGEAHRLHGELAQAQRHLEEESRKALELRSIPGWVRWLCGVMR
jgi:hypothetical protein